MVSKTLKSLVAFALLAGASQSFAIYSVNGPNGGPYNFDRYCASIDRENGSGMTIVERTWNDCNEALNRAKSQVGFKSFVGCHVCAQKFTSPKISQDPQPGGGTLDPVVVDQYIQRSRELRNRYDIDGFEREMDALTRSLSSGPHDE